MKINRFLHQLQNAFNGKLALMCLCGILGLAFAACESEEDIDPIYAVDLGLSVKWAWCNMGAERPEEAGRRYAWGEVRAKSNHDASNYAYYDPSTGDYTDIGKNICRTAYDAAHVTMGDGWRMPTKEEIAELVNSCTWEKAELKGCDGVFVTGPNGNKIFLPNVSNGYWSGTLASTTDNERRSHSLSWAHSLPWLDDSGVQFNFVENLCYNGLAIRPVKGELKPYVTTGEVSDITHCSATVSATVGGVEQPVSCGIIYGTSSTLSSLNSNRVETSSNGTYSIDLLELDLGTTYYYRAYAIIDGEELYGEILSFTTLLEVTDVKPVANSKTYTINGVSFTMIGVEGGTFTMGATSEQGDDADNDEKPAHQVALDSYYIGETEVTQALWQAVMGSNPSYFTGDLQRPVENVSWDDCQTFISKLNELTGESFRLPTEAEWEYAARGGSASKGYKYSGSSNIGAVAWYRSNSSVTTHAVKTKQPNELGIYDMNGNVLEWCADWYGKYSSSQVNPQGPSSGSSRVIRGGSWDTNSIDCRVASRSGLSDFRGNKIGFRIVRSDSRIYTVNGVSFVMIDVEGGTFTMGSPDSDSDAAVGEKPAHQVTLSNYSIGETEVTQALWQAVMGSNPSYFKGDLQRPVECVTWNDCQTFISKLNELTNESFRLPTEAEWEYAARGGKESKGYKYSGSNNIDEVAWYYNNSSRSTHPVKTKKANELGIYDMSGNVWEWCFDWFEWYSSSLQVDPQGPSSGSNRPLRGGTFDHGAWNCRVACRNNDTPDGLFTDHNYLGLRLVRSSVDFEQQGPNPAVLVTTGEATNITSESATLSGVVSGATNDISCGFIYGTYSNITSLNNKRVGAYYNSAYSIDVTYLQPGTTYYYCAYAIIGGEEQYGEVRSFTTLQNESFSSSKTYTVNGVSFTMIGVEGGTFTMGATSEQGSATRDDEKPAHQVTLSSYYIGETEVTQALWQAVMGSDPSYFTGDLQRPVEKVSWDDCQIFISKLNKLTGGNFRLPTEAEWEYAARGGKKSKGYKYSGSNTLGNVAWYTDNSAEKSHAVKTKQSNELGIYDMSGNVWEWCSDWYSSSYYSSSPQTNPTGPSTGSNRVLRGGSWYGFAEQWRVAHRYYNSPDNWGTNIGLRLVL